MILGVGVFAGWLVGLLIHKIAKKTYELKEPHHWWIVFLAVIPQLLTFQLSWTRTLIPNQFTSIILIGSQIGLIVFCIFNFHLWPFLILTAGLLMNFAVIILNGGLMPISPESVIWLVPNAPIGSWGIGERFGFGKDVVLSVLDMKLPIFADQFRLQMGSYRVIYSLGDVFIALGAFFYMLGLNIRFRK